MLITFLLADSALFLLKKIPQLVIIIENEKYLISKIHKYNIFFKTVWSYLDKLILKRKISIFHQKILFTFYFDEMQKLLITET